MGKISTYPTDTNVSLSDRLIGTDNENNNETKNFTVGALASTVLGQLDATLVLNAFSTVIQAPSALNTPLQVTFGGAQGSSSTPVMIDALGNITFNQSGLYIINAYGSVERTGSSGGTAIFLFRGLVNGTPSTTTKAFHLDTPDVAFPYEITIPFQATAGNVLTFQVMRDSSGVNHGGLYPHTNLGGWGNVPSTEILIWKIG
jgi:hypothetical protein